MAKKASGLGMKLLAYGGGLALFMVAWRFSVPLPMTGKTTTLLSAIAVVLGTLVGAREAAIIAGLYVFAAIIGLPYAVWGGHSTEAFMSGEMNGFNLGLIAAAYVAGGIAPGGKSTYAKLFLAVLIGHLAYMACGLAWLLRFGDLREAMATGLYPFLVPVAFKTVGSFLVAAAGARFNK